VALGGTVSDAPLVRARVPQPVDAPFGSAEPVEHSVMRAIDVGAAASAPPSTAFLDGVQRYTVAGMVGLVPVVRGYVAAAALARRNSDLVAECVRDEESIIVPLKRLSTRALRQLEGTGLCLHDSEAGDRPHPVVDIYMAARLLQSRREEMELAVGREYYSEHPAAWLVVDGSITAYFRISDSAPVVGVVKSHETQFLEGPDLEIALTLPTGHRTSVFARQVGGRHTVYTWYLRLWPSEGHDLLHGLVRLERPASESVLSEATEVSRWLLAERAPLAAPDGRWDRLLYPIRQVEEFLRARIGGWV
jgi:hypothetical protein